MNRTGKAIGWKWMVWDKPVGGLNSPSYRTGNWPIVQQATCRKTFDFSGNPAPQGHAVPHPDCSCGLYAYHTLQNAVADTMFCVDSVLVQVEAWGRIALHSRGFKAEFMQPIAVFVPVPDNADNGTLLDFLRLRYEVDIYPIPYDPTAPVLPPTFPMNPTGLSQRDQTFMAELTTIHTNLAEAIEIGARGQVPQMNSRGIRIHGAVEQLYRDMPADVDPVVHEALHFVVNQLLYKIFRVGGSPTGERTLRIHPAIPVWLGTTLGLPAMSEREGALA